MPNGSQINDEEINQMIASLKQNEAGTSNPIRGERVIAPPSRQPAPMMQPPMPPQPMSQPAAPMNQDNAPIASTSGITYSADPASQQSTPQPAPVSQPVQNNAPAPQQPFQPAAPAPAKPEEKPVEKKEEKVTPETDDKKPADKPKAKPASDLDDIKKQALNELRPLVDKLNLPPEEKFDTLLLLIRTTDDSTLISKAHETAMKITDESERAQALLDVVKEIDFFDQAK